MVGCLGGALPDSETPRGAKAPRGLNPERSMTDEGPIIDAEVVDEGKGS